jgi:hypothetical protein
MTEPVPAPEPELVPPAEGLAGFLQITAEAEVIPGTPEPDDAESR